MAVLPQFNGGSSFTSYQQDFGAPKLDRGMNGTGNPGGAYNASPSSFQHPARMAYNNQQANRMQGLMDRRMAAGRPPEPQKPLPQLQQSGGNMPPMPNFQQGGGYGNVPPEAQQYFAELFGAALNGAGSMTDPQQMQDFLSNFLSNYGQGGMGFGPAAPTSGMYDALYRQGRLPQFNFGQRSKPAIDPNQKYR